MINEFMLAKCLTELNAQACKAKLGQGDLRVCDVELITPLSWAGLGFLFISPEELGPT